MVCIFLTFDRSFATAVFPPRQNPNEVRHCARLIENVGEYTSKDTNKREQKQTRLHFAEREYLRRSQSTNKRGQCRIYLNIAERKYPRRSQRIRKVGRRSKRQLDYAETEYLRRDQIYLNSFANTSNLMITYQVGASQQTNYRHKYLALPSK